MSLLVISDLHLSPISMERNGKFLRFLEFAQENQHDILILGDLFDLWFGWKHLQFAYQASILNKMNSLAESGLRMDYVEGNRDFGIKLLQGRPFRKVYSRQAEIGWGEHFIYAEHGDLINRADKNYRFFRRITKNSITYFLLDHLPSSWLLALSAKLEKSLKNTNLNYRLSYPESYCEQFRNDAFRRGADIVLAGHFHEEREIRQQLDSRTLMFYNLPGWESGFRYLVIPKEDEGPYFMDFDE